MKTMKKFGLLVALALIVTIGGVYATWNYSGQTGINSSHEHLNSNMADYVAGENAYGNIRILDNDMDIIIDDASNDHVAELVITGDMVFIFTPYNNAPDEVKNNGIGMQWMVHQTAGYIYDFGNDSATDDVAIYTINQTAPVIFAGANVMKIDSTNMSNVFGRTVTNNEIGSFAVRVTADEVKTKIALSQSFTLSTLDDYHNFQECLAKGNVGITVSAVDNVAP